MILESIQDIEKIVSNILICSKTIDKLPTPVDEIIKYSELHVSKQDLSQVHPDFVTKRLHDLKRALSKVIGAIDIRKKDIYLDKKLLPSKKKFVKLHEVGHSALPWQKDCFDFMDDESTLDPDIKVTGNKSTFHPAC